jgi:hypothetical protein
MTADQFFDQLIEIPNPLRAHAVTAQTKAPKANAALSLSKGCPFFWFTDAE